MGMLGIFFGQVLGYPKQHDEIALLSVKTRNNRTFLHDSLLSNNSRVTATPTSVVVCLFCERVYIIYTHGFNGLRHHRLLSSFLPPKLSIHR